MLLGLLLGASGWNSAHAEIVRYVDARGNVCFYYRPSAEVAPRVLSTSRSGKEREKTLLPTIEKIAREMDVDPVLVRAVIRVESNFHPAAVSGAGARGLMQLMPATAASFGVQDLHDIEQNIRGGVRFLRHLKNRYGENLRKILAAYHAGETIVERHGTDVPPIAATKQYVVDVLHQYQSRAGLVSTEARPAAAAAKPAARPAKAAPARRAQKPKPAAPQRPIRMRVDRNGNLIISNVP